MNQTFHEHTGTVRVTAAGGTVTCTRQIREGQAVTSWASGNPKIEHRSLWNAAAIPDELHRSCRHWLERLCRRHPGLAVRIVSRSRTIVVTHPDDDRRSMRDRTTHTTIMLDGRAGSGAPVRGRSWLLCTASEVAEEELEALLAQAIDDSGRAVDPWPWEGRQVTLPVVFAPGVGGTAIHEVVGHGLEAEPDRPCPVPGTRLATDAITVIDDPTRPGLWGTRHIDDEGVPTTPVTLLSRGTVRAALHVRETSPRSSSARRMDYRSRPLARMSNTYLAPGTDDPAGLLAGHAVLYCQAGGSAEVRHGSRDVVMRIRTAQLWRDGTPASSHRHLALHFTSGELLHGVEGIGTDLAFGPGRCVKESQSVPVSHGAPTFRLARARVTGPGS